MLHKILPEKETPTSASSAYAEKCALKIKVSDTIP